MSLFQLTIIPGSTMISLLLIKKQEKMGLHNYHDKETCHAAKHLQQYLNAYVSGIILCMCPANERRCYYVTSSLIGWVHAQNDPYVSCTILPRLTLWGADVSSDIWKGTLCYGGSCGDHKISWESFHLFPVYFYSTHYHPGDTLLTYICMWTVTIVVSVNCH